MNLYITFGGGKYESTTEKIVEAAPRLGADQVLVYDEMWLKMHAFRYVNRWLWDHRHKPGYEQFDRRGFGMYAWKPLVILDALDRVQNGDFVLYTDADTYPVREFRTLFPECHRAGGLMAFEASAWTNRPWCKRDCYIVMGQDQPRYYDVQHAVARFLVVEKGPWAPRQLLMEWLTYSTNRLATTFDPSVLGPEIDGFREHRTEQAILTLLVHRYGFRLYREADQHGAGGMKDRDLYPEPLFQHVDYGGQNNADGIARANRFRNV